MVRVNGETSTGRPTTNRDSRKRKEKRKEEKKGENDERFGSIVLSLRDRSFRLKATTLESRYVRLFARLFADRPRMFREILI